MQRPHLPTLNMKHALFPPPEWKSKIAETFAPDRKQILRGVVHDPRRTEWRRSRTRRIVLGLRRSGAYAQALISRKSILDGDIIDKMTTPQQPPNARSPWLGWDMILVFFKSWIAAARGSFDTPDIQERRCG